MKVVHQRYVAHAGYSSVEFELRIICRSLDETGRAEVLAEPIVAARARGTGVVPAGAIKNGS